MGDGVPPIDPRERFDDLLVDHEVEHPDAETFDRVASSEAVRSGWVASALPVDPDGRVLLVYDEPEEAWGGPGGTARPGETLRETVVREVLEETGITIEPVRPEFVRDIELRHGERRAGFTFVFFSAVAPPEEPTLDGPEVDPQLTDVGWFGSLPADTMEREGTAWVLERARERTGRWP